MARLSNETYLKNIVIFFTFTILTLIWTYPLIFRMRNSFYGFSIYSDPIGTLWYAWWTKYALWNLHIFPTYCPISASPFGSFVPYYSPVNYFASVPLTILFGEVFSYNFFILLSFILSGTGVYFLVYYLTKDKLAGLVSGIVYAFSPYHLVRAMVHWDLAQIQWIPLYVLFLFKFGEDRRLKNLLWCLLFFFLIFFACSPYYLVFIPLLTAVYLLFRGFSSRKNIRIVIEKLKPQKIIFGVITIFGVSVVSLLLYHGFLSPVVPLFKKTVEEQFQWSLKWWSFLLPTSDNLFFGKYVLQFLENHKLTGYMGERIAYLGYLPLLLAFFALWKKRDWKVLFFTFLALLAFLSTLGPYARVFNFEILLPSYFLHKFAPFVRSVGRFSIFLQLSLAVLAGIGLKYILERIRGRRKRILLVFGVILIISIEFINVPPFKTVDLREIPEVYEWLSEEKGDFIVLEFPMVNVYGYSIGTYQYYQRIHQKKLFNDIMGTGIKIPQRYSGFWEILKMPSSINEYELLSALRHFGVTYIIVHTNLDPLYVAPPPIPKIRTKGLELANKFEDAEVYKITAQPMILSDLDFGKLITDELITTGKLRENSHREYQGEGTSNGWENPSYIATDVIGNYLELKFKGTTVHGRFYVFPGYAPKITIQIDGAELNFSNAGSGLESDYSLNLENNFKHGSGWVTIELVKNLSYDWHILHLELAANGSVPGSDLNIQRFFWQSRSWASKKLWEW